MTAKKIHTNGYEDDPEFGSTEFGHPHKHNPLPGHYLAETTTGEITPISIHESSIDGVFAIDSEGLEVSMQDLAVIPGTRRVKSWKWLHE